MEGGAGLIRRICSGSCKNSAAYRASLWLHKPIARAARVR